MMALRARRWRWPFITAVALLLWLLLGQGMVQRLGLALMGLDPLPSVPGLAGYLYYTQGFDGLWRHDIQTGVNERWWMPAAGSLVSGVAVAPDGSRLALAWAPPSSGGFQSGTTDLWLTSTSDPDPVPLLLRSDTLESWRDPFWTPDGRRLLVTHQYALRDDAGDAKSIHVALESVAQDGARRLLMENAEQASLSADGNQLVFLRPDPVTWSHGLMLARADGSHAQELVSSTTFRALMTPRFTPDGGSIVFSASGVRQDQGDAGSGLTGSVLAHGEPWHIWQYDIASGNLTRLTDSALDGPALAWSPHGLDILGVLAAEGLFLRARDRLRRLAAVTAEGRLAWAPQS